MNIEVGGGLLSLVSDRGEVVIVNLVIWLLARISVACIQADLDHQIYIFNIFILDGSLTRPHLKLLLPH